MSHIYGPVPSRRLGRSLGVDLVPFKTCSYDCIYCQLGRTTCKTITRQRWTSPEIIVRALEAKLFTRLDYITLAGSGEPTLYLQLGELIDRIKALTDIPVALLTNGSLLWQEDVRRDLQKVDLVIPSLDAGDEVLFQAVNRPHQDLSFARMLEGLIDLRREFEGDYWLEVFLLAEHTACEAEIAKLAACAARIKPDRIQLNTVTRPPAENYARGVAFEGMAQFAKMFHPTAEIVAESPLTPEPIECSAGQQEIIEMLSRRPCTVDDIARGLNMHRNAVMKYLDQLITQKRVEQVVSAGKIYYWARLQ